MNNPWFRNKTYGWGWYPANAKGWIVILLYAVGVALIAVRADKISHSGSDTIIGVVLPTLACTALLVFVSWFTGEKAVWMWGGVPLRTLPDSTRVRASAVTVTIPLFAGVMVAWTAVFDAFANFYDVYGTIFRVRECAIINPVLTPCFYGANAFLVAFLVSLWLIYKPTREWLNHLEGFLWFGAVFAATVLTYELLQYYHVFGGRSISCAPGVNPLFSACAIGGVLFLGTAALLKHFRSYESQS